MEQQLAEKTELTNIVTKLTSAKEDANRELIKAGFYQRQRRRSKRCEDDHRALAGADYFGNLGNFAHSRQGRGDILGQTVTGRRRCVKHTYVRGSLMPPTQSLAGNILSPTSATFATPLLLQSTLLPPSNTHLIRLPVWNCVGNQASDQVSSFTISKIAFPLLKIKFSNQRISYFPFNLGKITFGHLDVFFIFNKSKPL